jgi:acetate kinase
VSHILVLNAGSTSVKYSLFNKGLDLIKKGEKERIGLKGGIKNHAEAIEQILKNLSEQKINKKDIKAVGHRVVHGGEKYSSSVIINQEVINQLKKFIKLAPLHNPHNIAGIEACQELLPQTPQIACFDTAFYSDLEPKSYIYALPYELYEKHHIRRYGFHGISHQRTAEHAEEILNQKIEKIITCHLGGGSSVTAIKNGKAINTSMGFTPLEGLVMTTRCGDIDPAIVPYLVKELGYDIKEIDNLMNKKSGLTGLCGKRDFRVVLDQKDKDKRMKLTFDIFCQGVVKYIGYYIALLKGVDVIAFTAGIGQNSWQARKAIIDKFKFLGVNLDERKNKNNELIISTPNSKVTVMAIPANEELKIAQEVQKLT